MGVVPRAAAQGCRLVFINPQACVYILPLVGFVYNMSCQFCPTGDLVIESHGFVVESLSISHGFSV